MNDRNELHPKSGNEPTFIATGLSSTFVVDDGNCFASSAFAAACLTVLLPAGMDEPECR